MNMYIELVLVLEFQKIYRKACFAIAAFWWSIQPKINMGQTFCVQA